jgi:hypothetical protein
MLCEVSQSLSLAEQPKIPYELSRLLIDSQTFVSTFIYM